MTGRDKKVALLDGTVILNNFKNFRDENFVLGTQTFITVPLEVVGGWNVLVDISVKEVFCLKGLEILSFEGNVGQSWICILDSKDVEGRTTTRNFLNLKDIILDLLDGIVEKVEGIFWLVVQIVVTFFVPSEKNLNGITIIAVF